MTFATSPASPWRLMRWSAPASEMKLLGCFAARKIWLAFSIPTVSSVGAWKTSNACAGWRYAR